MKNLTKIGLIYLMGILLFTSCDVMDTKPTESIDGDMVWSSKITFEGFVFATYADVFGRYSGDWQNKNTYTNIEGYSPSSVHCNLTEVDGIPLETGVDRYTDFINMFDKDKSFALMRRCNLIIEKAQSSSFTESEKSELVAEGHFLRGVIFFMQAYWTGRIVPITQVLGESSNEEFMTPLTKDPSETYKYIIDDFKAAAEGLPETSKSGLANRYAAYAYLSRAALQAYAYTMNDEYLTISENASKAVIGSGKYPLTSNYGNMFVENGAYDPEIILGYYRLEKNTDTNTFQNELLRCVPNIKPDQLKNTNSGPALKDPAGGPTFEGWAGYFPTQELVDQYLVIDQADGKAKLWYETSQYLNQVNEHSVSDIRKGDLLKKREEGKLGSFWDVPEDGDLTAGRIVRYGSVKNKEKINEIMYEHRDNRFYGTIVYDSCQWLLNEWVTICCQGNLWAGVHEEQSTGWYTTATGYYWRKGVYNVQPRLYGGYKTNYHLVMARAGEMYLNLAEVYLLRHNVSEAVKQLNVTRQKHGGLPPSLAVNEEDAWKDYIRERCVEMAKENDTYWSYLRWGKYGGYANEGKPAGDVIEALSRPAHKILISKARDKFFVGTVFTNNADKRVFTKRRYLMPIPQSGLDKRAASGLVENNNPGW